MVNYSKSVFYRTWRMLFVLICISCFLFACNSQSQENQTAADTTKRVFKHADWCFNKNIYEVNLRQYTPSGTFKEFETHIPRLKEMGVDILWLMPVHPIGVKNRKGTLGSYYAVKDYLATNPDYGTMDDFKHLVKTVHDAGMYIIIDWVANHTSWDNALIDQHPDWYQKDSLGKIKSPFDWTDVAQLNYDVPALNTYMADALKFWVKDAGIDGFRCDVAGMVPIRFWDSAHIELEKVNPNVFMLAEEEKPLMHSAFDASYGWKFHHIMNKIAQGKTFASAIDTYYVQERNDYKPSDFRMFFTSNHDENSWNGDEYERMKDAAKTFAALCYVLPSFPLTYTGQEEPNTRRFKFFEKDLMVWKNYSLKDFYKTLNGLKHDNQALWSGEKGGEMIKIATNDDKSAYVFLRKADNNVIFSIFNLSGKDGKFKLSGDAYAGEYINVFTGKPETFAKDAEVKLAKWEYKILIKK